MPSLQIMPPRVPLTDPRTGSISREWYRFLFDQFMTVVSTATVVEGGLRTIPGIDGEPGEDGPMGIPGPMGATGPRGLSIPGADGQDGEDAWFIPGPKGDKGDAGGVGGSSGQVVMMEDCCADEQLFAFVQRGPASAPFTISVSASPFTYTAPFDGAVVISGGGVTTVEFSRDSGSTLFGAGTFYAPFPLRAGDQLVVTYVAAPTMVFIPS